MSTTESEFFGEVGRLTREQGWTLETVSQVALAQVASTKAERIKFLRTLRRIQAEENQVNEG